MKKKKFFNRETILEKLLNAGEISAEILLGLSTEALYIAKAMALSPHQAQQALRKNSYKHIRIDLKSKVAFSKLLSKLKKENLITKANGKIAITRDGKNYLQSRYKKPSMQKQYETEGVGEDEIVLVAFDIPEKYRNKRDWIRFHLQRFNFKVLQKSVWWGTTGLPKEFLKDMKKYKMLSYVHIFSVKKKGTISIVIS